MRAQSRGGLFGWLDRRAVEKLLGIPLPTQATDLRYRLWRPSTDLAVYDAYIKFRSPYAAYPDLVRRRKLVLFKASGPTAHLPAAWLPIALQSHPHALLAQIIDEQIFAQRF